MPRTVDHTIIKAHSRYELVGLTPEVIAKACNHVHKVIEGIDEKLLEGSGERLSQIVELANLSSMIGNLFGAGIEKFSDGALRRNGPHMYPDLVAGRDGLENVEIKMALEDNIPKGHLAKEGYYLTARYVLLNEDGSLTPNTEEDHPHKPGKKRVVRIGTVPCIWEVRFGWLDLEDFNSSNTAGDSGKTAVVNAGGMRKLEVVYCDLTACPLPRKGGAYKQMQSSFGAQPQITLELF